MFKILLIVFIVGYVFIKGLGFFFRTILGGPTMGRSAHSQSTYRQPTNGNLRVDHMPNDKKTKKDFKGGEYVDFEEVK